MTNEAKSSSLFRIGILCNQGYLQQWQVACIKDVQAKGLASFDIIYSKEDSSTKNKNQSTGFKHLFYRLYLKIFPIQATFPVKIEALLPNTPIKEVVPVKKGKYGELFSAEDVQDVRSRNLDVLIRFGFGILKGEILQCTKFGVWSFHHGDELQFRGGPVSFWELYKKASVQGAILQKLTEKIDGGYILKKGQFNIFPHSYTHSVNHVLYGTSTWISSVIKSIAWNREVVDNWQLSESNASINRTPSNLRMCAFVIQQFTARLRFYMQSYFLMEIWQTGFTQIDQSTDIASLKHTDITWIKNPDKKTYYADPFPELSAIEGRKEHKIYVEEFDYRSNRGKLAALLIRSNGRVEQSEDIFPENRVHASFPNRFDHDDSHYLLPEMSATPGLHLFKKIEQKWTKVTVDIPNVSLVDPCLVHYQDKWWLFASDKHYSNDSLVIYYSTRIEGPYHPHALNPVKNDITSSRPAGKPFIMEQQLYRPAQNSAGTYGKGLQLMKIIDLTPGTFKERAIQSINGEEIHRRFKGIHTWNILGSLAFVDVKFYRFSIFHAWRRLRYRLRSTKK